MAFKIARSDLPENFVDFVVDVNGEVLEFTVPKFDHIRPEKYAAIEKWAKNRGKGALDSTEADREMIRLHTSAEQHKLVKELTTGQLRQIGKHWSEESAMPVGESEPSGDSSGANTEE